MDIVRLKGGLGNQMFQYAFAESLRSKGRRVRCNRGYYKKRYHSGNYELGHVFQNVELDEIEDDYFDRIDKKWQTIRDDKLLLNKFKEDTPNRFFWVEEADEEGRYISEVYDTRACTFVGFWQTSKYFENIRESILEKYVFYERESDLRMFKNQLDNGTKYVSVHVRRGDYLKCSEIFGNICNSQYYESAIRFFRNVYDDPTFVFFSDDIEWVKNNIRIESAMYITPNMFDNYYSWYDMYLMTLCSGNIIANSTFSWWGAWLNKHNEKKVVAPRKWSNTREMSDICPKEWIRL